MGLVKMLLRMIDANNTRDIAILIYYSNGKLFNYQARFQQGKRSSSMPKVNLLSTKVPRFFKLRIDSDRVTPYGKPMHGKLIYLNQHPKDRHSDQYIGAEEQGS